MHWVFKHFIRTGEWPPPPEGIDDAGQQTTQGDDPGTDGRDRAGLDPGVQEDRRMVDPE